MLANLTEVLKIAEAMKDDIRKAMLIFSAK